MYINCTVGSIIWKARNQNKLDDDDDMGEEIIQLKCSKVIWSSASNL